MKAFKILAGLMVVLLVMAIGAGIFLVKNLDGLVKTVIEDAGSQTLKTEVRLSEAAIGLKEGRAALHGLTIANPPGFSQSPALSLGEVAVDIELKSLGSGVIVLNEVLVSDAHLLAEQKDLTRINLNVLLQNVKQQGQSSAAASEPKQTTSDGEPIRLAIEKLTLEAIDMRLLSDQWGERTVTVPPIYLSNLGDKEHGLTPEQMASAILQPLLDQAKRVLEDELKQRAKEEARGAVEKKLKESLDEDDQEKLNRLKSLFDK